MKTKYLASAIALLAAVLVSAQCTNVALNKPATASSTYASEFPSRAFDGNCSTGWTAPGYSAYIQVDLQGSYTINNINLLINQAPNGVTTHQIYTATTIAGPWNLVETITGFTSNGQLLERCYSSAPLTNVGAVRISTTSTPSWVAWNEIGIFSTSTASATITPSGPLAFCFGGSVVLTASAGVSYVWSSGQTTQSITANNSGVYTVTVTGTPASCVNGTVPCTNCASAIASVTVTVNPSPTASVTGTNTICAGQSTNLIASGGGTYLWSTGATTAAITVAPVSNTVYTVTVTSVAGCTATASRSVTVNPLPTVSLSGTNHFCPGGSTLLTGTSGGTSQWYRNGAPIIGANSNTYLATTAGVYNMTKTNTNGCFDSAAVGRTVIIDTPPAVASITSTAIGCYGGSNGTATVIASGTPTLTYNWSPSGGTAATASGLSQGSYTVTITDGNTCTTTSTVSITQPSALSSTTMQTNVSCNGGSNGDAMVMVSGGTGPYSYAWSPTGGTNATASGLASGTYNCTITDANGCTNTQTVNITQPSALTSTSNATSILCNGGTSTVVIGVTGGTSPYTGTGTFTVTAGTYSYTVTDANGCTNTTSITVTEPTALTAAATATSISCNGGNATVTVVGAGGTAPYTGEGSFTVTAGTYSYTVTDANGCTTTSSITVTEPIAVWSIATPTHVTCFLGTDGSIDLNPFGGTPGYTYDWNNGQYTTEDLAGIVAGVYSVLITDANGCSYTDMITVLEPAQLIATVTSVNDPSGCGATNGSIDITVSGGTVGYSYLWSNAATTEDLTGVGAGAYSCVVTDTNGCTANVSGNLNDPNAPTVTLALAVDTLCSTDAAFTLTGESPAGGTFSGPGVTAGSFDPAAAGVGIHMISYTFTDINGCSGSTTDSIFVDVCTDAQSPVSGLVSHFSIFPNPNDGTFTIQTTSVADVMIYDAQGKLVFTQKVQANVQTQMNVAESGMYLVTVTDASGARTSQRVMVTK